MSDKTRRSFGKVARALAKMGKTVPEAFVGGLRVAGEEIMTDVKSSRPGHGVPVDTGVLRSTGRVTGPTGGRVLLAFGGAAAPYALRQHEELQYRHPVGEARYLVRGIERYRIQGSQALVSWRANVDAGIRAARR